MRGTPVGFGGSPFPVPPREGASMPSRLRRLPLPFATVLMVAGLVTAGPAAGSGGASTLTPRAQVQAFHDRLHAAMVARGLHPQPAIPATRNSAKGPNAFRTA